MRELQNTLPLTHVIHQLCIWYSWREHHRYCRTTLSIMPLGKMSAIKCNWLRWSNSDLTTNLISPCVCSATKLFNIKQPISCIHIRWVGLPWVQPVSFSPEASFGYCRCLRLSVCVSVCVCGNHMLVLAITHPFKLGSSNLDHRCKRPWLRSLLFWGVIDLVLNFKVKIYPILSLPVR